MKAIFEVPWDSAISMPDIPSFDVIEGYSLIWPPTPDKIDVQIEANEDAINTMKNDSKYTWIEDVDESEE